ncbi:MAG: enoyl-CoA hydratase-related protein [Rugosibacter sp.]
MSKEKSVAVTRRGAVMEICLSRPQVRNALDADCLQALLGAFTEAANDQSVRTVMLTGEGPVFCAGGDLKSIFTSHAPQAIQRFLDLQIRPLIRAMINLDKPILAVLNGPAAGAGISLTMASDLVVAAEEASFVTAFGKIGVMPDSGALYFLAHRLGMNRAKELVFLNQTLTAKEAKEIGLYNWVVPSKDLMVEGRKIADQLASGPTVAHGLAKKALRDALRSTFDAFMDNEALSMALLISTEDQTEGLAAFAEKRNPQFVGR